MKGERSSFCWLTLAHVCTSQGWAKQKSGAQNAVQVSRAGRQRLESFGELLPPSKQSRGEAPRQALNGERGVSSSLGPLADCIPLCQGLGSRPSRPHGATCLSEAADHITTPRNTKFDPT